MRKWNTPTKTKESFGHAVNINTIAGRAFAGQPIAMTNGVAHYGDVSGHEDLQHALELVDRAQRVFLAIPAAVRAEFGNSPVDFVRFMTAVEQGIPGTRSKAIGLGLVEPSPEEAKFIRGEKRRVATAKLLELTDPIPSVEEDASDD